VLVQARRYARAVRGDLANGGSLGDWRLVTGRTQDRIEAFAEGEYDFVTGRMAAKIERALPERLAEWLRESPHYPFGTGDVPAELVHPLLDLALQQHETDLNVAALLGMNPRRLFQIRRQGSVDWKTADVIITKLLGPQGWLNDEQRRKWYFERSVF